MKAWNPSTRSYEATPPMPEFVGQWRMPEEVPREQPSLLVRIARGVAGTMVRLGAALEVALDGETSSTSDGFAVPTGTAPGEPGRIVLPMSSGVSVKPGELVRITSRPQNTAFRPERIVIGGSPGDWLVNEIKIGRRSQLCDSGVLPGDVFAADVYGLEVSLDTVMTAQDFMMEVTYVGPDPEGAPFVCAAMGKAALDMLEEHTNRIYLPLSSGVRILPNTTAEIHATPQDPFRAERIVIGGRPENWVVNDIKVGNRSQLAQSGDIPGVAFAATSRGTEISFETAQTAMRFALVVTYVGDRPEGEPLLACAIGSVPA